MSDPAFVYVVYIATTPEKVWQAIVDGDVAREYWAHENVSDWKPGSPWEHRAAGGAREVKLRGRVLEVDPPRRLVLTWSEASGPDAALETRVTFEIEPVGEMTRLTVTHQGYDLDSDFGRRVRGAWPRVISSMKSYLETGRALVTWAEHRH